MATVDFISETRTFVNNNIAVAGFSRAGAVTGDLYNGPADNVFSNWDMTTSIGPVVGLGRLIQWDSSWPSIETTGGTLEIDSTVDVPWVFTATVGSGPIGSNYCSAVPNATGLSGVISA